MSDRDWLDIATLGIALWGAGLSTAHAYSRRRPHITVSAEFTTGSLGRVRNHGFFAVRIHNHRERPVTIRRIEWDSGNAQFELHEWTGGGHPSLPLDLGDNQERAVFFDIDTAANAIKSYDVRVIRVYDASNRKWETPLDPSVSAEAREVEQPMDDWDEEVGGS